MCYLSLQATVDWSDVKDALELGTFIIGVAALIYTARGLILTVRSTRAQFWLSLRDQFSRHDETHLKLRPGGPWSGSSGAPVNSAEWASVEAYMGLFEHCEALLDDGLVDEKTFARIYSYRLKNIVANPVIVEEKLRKRKAGWLSFLALLDRMKIEIPGGNV